MRETLVLNRNFLAVHICDWEKVMSLLYRGQAEAVDSEYRTYNFEDWKELSKAMTEYPNGIVRAVNFSVAVPEVVKLTVYDSLPTNCVKFNRKTLYHHYGQRCCYCGKKFGTESINLDHVTPKSRGGRTEWTNIVLSCLKCNMLKANRTPEEAHMTMRYTPHEPTWRPTYSVPLGHLQIKESWKAFVNRIYWTGELEE